VRALIEVRRNARGAWCVFIGGQMISDHATHEAARLTAQRHQRVLAELAEEQGR
jgi:hypothetical protein